MDGAVPPTFIDKSSVLDVKPLRSLSPVFSSPPQAQASPFICSLPFGPCPPGFSSFYPFSISQGSQSSPDQNQQTARAGVTNQGNFTFSQPNRSADIRGLEVNEEGFIDSQRQPAPHLRRSKSLQKKAKRNQDAAFLLSVDGDKGSFKNLIVGCSSFQQDDGNREMVNYVLMKFDALRRRLCQVEDAKEAPTGIIKRADLKSGNMLMSKGLRTNMRKRIGLVPGIEIGDIFFFRIEMCLVGLHSQSMAGVDYMIDKTDLEEEPLAVSIVSSGGYDDDVEDRDVLIYSGQGENINRKDKQVADQKLERGNLALDRSLRRANEVRVIRGIKDVVNPSSKVYVYDGLYRIQESWIEKGQSGCNIFKYKLVRIPGQPGAFSHWKSIQKWKEGFSSRAGLIISDLTSGAESLPVSLVNDIDDEKCPAHFTYFPTLKYSKSFNIMQPSYGCNCCKACLPGDLNCSCIRKNGGDFPYVANNILVSRKPLVYECGPTCPCFPHCKNRVSQIGLKVHLEVFKTADKGWGLRSWDPIRAGNFICEYGGEVIDSVKVRQGGVEGDSDEYIFDTTCIYENSLKWNYEPGLLDEGSSVDLNEDYKIPSPLIINAKNVGNVARFMNHSCSPNVFWQPVLYEHNTESFLHVAFFAIKHIPPMTELTYDYGISESEKYHAQSNNALRMKKECLCRSSKCRGHFG